MEEVYDVEQSNNDNDNSSRHTRDRGISDLLVCVNHYFMVLFLSDSQNTLHMWLMGNAYATREA